MTIPHMASWYSSDANKDNPIYGLMVEWQETTRPTSCGRQGLLWLTTRPTSCGWTKRVETGLYERIGNVSMRND